MQHRPHHLACHTYIERNPLRAGMVSHPGEYRWYRWSSYAANAQGSPDPIITPATGIAAGRWVVHS
ncbi:MAG: hypothetical protein ACQEXI_04255 [Pseudomonadota bacterium]